MASKEHSAGGELLRMGMAAAAGAAAVYGGRALMERLPALMASAAAGQVGKVADKVKTGAVEGASLAADKARETAAQTASASGETARKAASGTAGAARRTTSAASRTTAKSGTGTARRTTKSGSTAKSRTPKSD